MNAQSGSRIKPPRSMEMGAQSHATAALRPGKRTSAHSVVGWVGRRAVLDGCGKISTDIRSLDHPTRSE